MIVDNATVMTAMSMAMSMAVPMAMPVTVTVAVAMAEREETCGKRANVQQSVCQTGKEERLRKNNSV